MIVGYGAVVRLVRGLQKRRQIESAIQECNDLRQTPALSYYRGAKRFEVATIICDAKLGLIANGSVASMERGLELAVVGNYLDVLEREYRMAYDEAAAVSATKAEVYALGLALKEIALLTDETADEFKTQLDERFEQLRTETAQRLRAIQVLLVLMSVLAVVASVLVGQLLGR